MEDRTNRIIDHLIQSTKVSKSKDLELCLTILRGAIEKDMIDELADEMLAFCEKKALERQMREN